ncbi:MAG: aminoglycoside phosphotransferase family protein [Candidatus Hodarchaeales archaeon]
MKIDECIYSVLNYGQLEYFCKKFNLDASDIKSNFDGWRKLVLYTDDRVFMFPRDPRGIEWLEQEMTAYEIMAELDHLPVPKLISREKDLNISYYEFAVVTRLKGISYSKLEEGITFNDLSKMLINLAKVITLWHEIPVTDLPMKVKKQKNFPDGTRYSWEIKALYPSTMKKAIDYIYDTILVYAEKYQKEYFRDLRRRRTLSLWMECIKEIVSLSHVFLHADIHEDQILVESKESMEICGILDWETIGIGNPVWEFNFFEWGFGIWDWWNHFSEIRRLMWKTYLDERGIQLSSLEGLDLFYTLSEFLIVLQPDKSLVRLIGKNLEKSVKMCLEKLVNITKRLEKNSFL